MISTISSKSAWIIWQTWWPVSTVCRFCWSQNSLGFAAVRLALMRRPRPSSRGLTEWQALSGYGSLLTFMAVAWWLAGHERSAISVEKADRQNRCLASPDRTAGCSRTTFQTDIFARRTLAEPEAWSADAAPAPCRGLHLYRAGRIGAFLRAGIGVSWRHAFGDTTPLATHVFAGSDAFTVAGVPIARDAAVIEAGLDFDHGSSYARHLLQWPVRLGRFRSWWAHRVERHLKPA